MLRLIFLSLLVLSVEASADTAAIYDDFDSPGDWTFLGEGEIRDGVLTLQSTPSKVMKQSFAYKDFQLPIRDNTWIHFRVRTLETLMGADMYTEVLLGKDGDFSPKLDAQGNAVDPVYFQIGFNGEQHWVTGNEDAPCSKKSQDDLFFFGMKTVAGAHDILTPFPSDAKTNFDTWTLYSIKYEQTGIDRRIRIFVNGSEISYRKADAGNDYIDNRSLKIPEDMNWIRIRPSVLNDGASYSMPRKSLDYRRFFCYAASSPSRPTPFNVKHLSKEPKLTWMEKYDLIAKSLEEGKNLWDGIFSGDGTDLRSAVLMGAMPLPSREHVQWTFTQPGERDRIARELAELQSNAYPTDWPLSKRYVWNMLHQQGKAHLVAYHSYGGITSDLNARAIHRFYGGITADDIRYSSIWNAMPENEKDLVPREATEQTAQIQWDFVMVYSTSSPLSIRNQIMEAVYAGKLGQFSTANAINFDMIHWSELSNPTQCSRLSGAELQKIRNSAKASPSFCMGYPK